MAHQLQTHQEKYHQSQRFTGDAISTNIVDDSSGPISSINSEWVLFDPSDDDNDILSSSFSQASHAASQVKSSVLTHTQAPVEDEASEDDRSLVSILVGLRPNSSHIQLRLPNHDGVGLFDESVVPSRNSFVSLKDRINEWQREQARSVLEEKRRHSLVNLASHHNEIAESWGIDDRAHLYSSAFKSSPLAPSPSTGTFETLDQHLISKDRAFNLKNSVDSKVPSLVNKGRTNRFYGDYLLKGLTDKQLSKVKKCAHDLSSCIGESINEESPFTDSIIENSASTSYNTAYNSSGHVSNAVIRKILETINSKFYGTMTRSESGSSVGISDNNNVTGNSRVGDNFWHEDAQSIYSSRLSVSSHCSSLWRVESWGQVI
ncbi:hypothetical protein DASC09_002640 [Saccharomycopsis crataegensis]|uniref:Uncharacterized protein n=1 Tax=Saccharomycopsis crataegensis TaxID=43959 RepID=A0AAV5QF17_9ASCO|nr:hypothetical protein DASC09_002640 [Saccharomycopsis crataegensis]